MLLKGGDMKNVEENRAAKTKTKGGDMKRTSREIALGEISAIIKASERSRY